MRFSILGWLIALGLYDQSLVPIFLPLTTSGQIIFSSVTAAVGYKIGESIELALRKLKLGKYLNWLENKRFKIFALIILLVTAVAITHIRLWQQKEYQLLLAIKKSSLSTLIIFIGTLLGLFLLLQLDSLIRIVAKYTSNVFRQTIIASTLRIILTIVGYLGLIIGILALQIWLDIKSWPKPELNRTNSYFRSGGPNSLVSWEGLGQKGKEFIAREVDTLEIDISIFENMPPKTMPPIRIYAGIKNEPDLEKRVELIMKELERTEAFKRSVIVFFTPTASGWVNPVTVEAVEYITGGNSVSVSMQYAHQQAFLQYIQDKTLPGKASNLLFKKIRERLNSIPVEQRPKIYIYGESLGSLGSQQMLAKMPLEEILQNIDGALWIGSPSSGAIWIRFGLPKAFQSLTDQSEVNSQIRVVSNPIDLLKIQQDWPSPRILFLYNKTDPVVWTTTDLIYKPPEWMKNRELLTVNKYSRWWPVLTFGRLWFELFATKNVPNGVGHAYNDKIPCAMANVLGGNIDKLCVVR